ncbi:MAG: helix-turn-helix domain-containing protein, partial [Bifidobacterium sp.]|nr:helix-turn-helix domain-containing protein [Bifidobacterium sp.]
MLSVSECAQILGVSTARVRQLIASGSLEATKVGRSWVLPEVAVYDRLLKNPSSGRPSSSSDDLHSERVASSVES